MVSNPIFRTSDFFCIFKMNLAMATLDLKEMGKFLWEGRKKVLPCWLSQFSFAKLSWVLLENTKRNLVFHFGGGRYASFPQKPVVKVFFAKYRTSIKDLLSCVDFRMEGDFVSFVFYKTSQIFYRVYEKCMHTYHHRWVCEEPWPWPAFVARQVGGRCRRWGRGLQKKK